MTGYPGLNYDAFRQAEVLLRSRGFTVRNPSNIDDENPKHCGHHHEVINWCDDCCSRTWTWYMRHALRMLLECEGVALLPGWQQSRGAVLEVTNARSLDMPLDTVEGWIKTITIASN